ncbi:MAG: acyloxyacyl hydrolase [Bacteroidales bacterium]|nr:acyloxyacyl hydrolase [Bacteroidales bacterium]
MKLLYSPLKGCFVCLIICCALCYRAGAQNYFVGGDVRYGHVLCNSAESRADINFPTYGFSFYLGNNFTGGEYWHSYWNYPSFGLELSYDYIDNYVVGSKLGALFFIRPSFYKTEKLSLNAFLGLGLSYFSKTHDRSANPRNTYIGSHVNALINLGGQVCYFVTDRLALSAALKFSHSSNGQLCRPNLGLNFLQVEVGAEYYFQKYNYAVTKQEKTKYNPNRINLSFSPAVTESKHTGEHYFAAALSIAYSRQFHPCYSFGIGYDFMYNGTIASTPWYTDASLSNCFSQGVVGNFECSWGNVALRVGLGAYVFNAKYQKLPYYERAGLFYYLGKNKSQYIGLSIKAHAANAEYIEWTYGISLI